MVKSLLKANRVAQLTERVMATIAQVFGLRAVVGLVAFLLLVCELEAIALAFSRCRICLLTCRISGDFDDFGAPRQLKDLLLALNYSLNVGLAIIELLFLVVAFCC